jgi:amidohydrolase
MLTPKQFMDHAESVRDDLIAMRRDFHQHPELAFQEVRTAGIVANTLQALGMEVQTGVGKTGVVAVLEGDHSGPTVLVRADMDALPIVEDNPFAYVSQQSGVMHACGHDGHTAIALGTATLFASLRDQLHGRIKFVFQPAEEIAQGARAMIEDGVLTDPAPDYTVGLHLWNSLPTGVLGVADGPVMAGASKFDVLITGKGGHAASPHLSIDPVVAAAHIITALQSIVSRTLDPFDAGVISVAKVQAGDTHNVIPQTAKLTGTIRYFRSEVRDSIYRRMHEVVTHVAAGMGCEAVLDIQANTLPVVNDPVVTRQLREQFKVLVGENGLDTRTRTMGAEDVGMFMTDTPGLYFFVGAADTSQDTYYGHHHPRFSFDENALPLGMALLSTAIAQFVMSE